MARRKPVIEFSAFNWRNVSFGFILVGLIVMLLAKELALGLSIMAVGALFLIVLRLTRRRSP